MVCSIGSCAPLCEASRVGECRIHPLWDATAFSLSIGASWFHINADAERFMEVEKQRAEALLSDEQRAEAAALKAAEEEAAVLRSARVAADREETIRLTREMKAVNDAKDLAARLQKRRINGAVKLCSWVRFQQEATAMLAFGSTQDDFIKSLTPGRERITIRDALYGCFAHTKFLQKKAKCDCPFSHDAEAVAEAEAEAGGRAPKRSFVWRAPAAPAVAPEVPRFKVAQAARMAEKEALAKASADEAARIAAEASSTRDVIEARKAKEKAGFSRAARLEQKRLEDEEIERLFAIEAAARLLPPANLTEKYKRIHINHRTGVVGVFDQMVLVRFMAAERAAAAAAGLTEEQWLADPVQIARHQDAVEAGMHVEQWIVFVGGGKEAGVNSSSSLV
jgi:hypothetical protein